MLPHISGTLYAQKDDLRNSVTQGLLMQVKSPFETILCGFRSSVALYIFLLCDIFTVEELNKTYSCKLMTNTSVVKINVFRSVDRPVQMK